MSEVERQAVLKRIQRYIKKTTDARLKRYYDMDIVEIGVIGKLPQYEGLHLAYQYGRAKGYRAAMKVKGGIK